MRVFLQDLAVVQKTESTTTDLHLGIIIGIVVIILLIATTLFSNKK